MAVLYFDHRLIIAKIVYIGAEGAGSNTNVRTLHGIVPAGDRGELLTFGAVDDDQSYLFEYEARDAKIPGFRLRVRVYSHPGGVQSAAQRDEVLRDADGVVLVLDARPDRGAPNRAAVDELNKRLFTFGRPLPKLPLVVQVNHRDATDARAQEAVVAEVGLPSAPVFSSVARSAKGVAEAHAALIADLAARVRDNLGGRVDAIPLVVGEGEPETDEDLVGRHTNALSAESNPAAGFLGKGAADMRVAMTRRYSTLEASTRVEIPFQPREFAGTRPVHVLDARLEADAVVVDIVMERLSGGDPRRLPIVLANRPADAAPVRRHATLPTAGDMKPILKDLPEKVELAPPEPVDFPPVWYGVAGLAGGILAGLLIGFIAFG